jgi:hypothetical protein
VLCFVIGVVCMQDISLSKGLVYKARFLVLKRRKVEL